MMSDTASRATYIGQAPNGERWRVVRTGADTYMMRALTRDGQPVIGTRAFRVRHAEVAALRLHGYIFTEVPA